MLFWAVLLVFAIPLYLLIDQWHSEKNARKRQLERIQRKIREKERTRLDEGKITLNDSIETHVFIGKSRNFRSRFTIVSLVLSPIFTAVSIELLAKIVGVVIGYLNYGEFLGWGENIGELFSDLFVVSFLVLLVIGLPLHFLLAKY